MSERAIGEQILAALLRIEARLASSAPVAEGRAATKSWNDDALLQLLRRAWTLYGDSVFQVADLKAAGAVDPASTVELGKALGRLADLGGRLGPFVLKRVVIGPRAGNVWQMTRPQPW